MIKCNAMMGWAHDDGSFTFIVTLVDENITSLERTYGNDEGAAAMQAIADALDRYRDKKEMPTWQ